MEKQKSLFYTNLDEYYSSNKDDKKPWNYEESNEVVTEILLAKQTQGKKTRRQLHLLSLYDTMEVAKHHVVIKKIHEETNYVYITPYEEIFKILYTTHINIGHGCRDKMMYVLKTKYQIPRPAIEKFLETCKICQSRKNRTPAKSMDNSVIPKDLYSRGQIDLIDFQSCQDGDYKWLLYYQEYKSKFICLRPLKSKQKSVLAFELLKIFLELRVPAILQSDHGQDFVYAIVSELVILWPGLKIINEPPRHSRRDILIKKSSQDVENMLRAWMRKNKSTNWSFDCFFIQFQQNCSKHRFMGHTPYKAFFGADSSIGMLAINNIPIDRIVKHKKVSQLRLENVKRPESIANKGN